MLKAQKKEEGLRLRRPVTLSKTVLAAVGKPKWTEEVSNGRMNAPGRGS